jgi:hypothetical protein
MGPSRSVNCPQCTFVAKSRAGLATHQRKAHPVEGGAASNSAAVEVTIAELRRMGRLERVDAARVQALRSIAAVLDQHPFNSQMWREYREALEGLTADDGDTGSVDELIDQLSAPVRDPA